MQDGVTGAEHPESLGVVGSDAARGLALVQPEGGSAVKPAAMGNSSDFAAGAAAVRPGAG